MPSLPQERMYILWIADTFCRWTDDHLYYMP